MYRLIVAQICTIMTRYPILLLKVVFGDIIKMHSKKELIFLAQKQVILICDDQEIIHETLRVYLENEGFECLSAMNGQEAVEIAESKKIDLIILDLMMPKKSGVEVCRQVRENAQIPIIMLTAKGEEIDRIIGLEIGADDYIVKPFSAREVVARVKAVLRRVSNEKKETQRVIRYGDIEININNYEVKVKGEKLALTPKEVEILQLLAAKPGRVYTREQILSQVWGYDFYGDTRAVDTQIKRIRQKLPQEDVNFKITTVYGVGYKFEAER